MGEQKRKTFFDAKTLSLGRKGLVVAGVSIALLSFVGGVFAATKGDELIQTVTSTAAALTKQTDMEWAVSKKFLTESVAPDTTITQAEFLKMVMTEYGDTVGVPEIVVAKAQNHPAKNIYNAAKANGLISCSCVVKPDQPLSLEEASEFIMLGVNRKAGRNLLGIQNVEDWAGRPGPENKQPLTFKEAATLIRNMDQTFEENQLKGREVPKNGYQVGTGVQASH